MTNTQTLIEQAADLESRIRALQPDRRQKVRRLTEKGVSYAEAYRTVRMAETDEANTPLRQMSEVSKRAQMADASLASKVQELVKGGMPHVAAYRRVMSENPDLAAQYEVQRFGERPEPAPRPQVDADLCKRPDETAGEYLRRYREAAISNERSR